MLYNIDRHSSEGRAWLCKREDSHENLQICREERPKPDAKRAQNELTAKRPSGRPQTKPHLAFLLSCQCRKKHPRHCRWVRRPSESTTAAAISTFAARENLGKMCRAAGAHADDGNPDTVVCTGPRTGPLSRWHHRAAYRTMQASGATRGLTTDRRVSDEVPGMMPRSTA